MRAIPERFRGVFTTRHYTNPRLPLPYLTAHFHKGSSRYTACQSPKFLVTNVCKMSSTLLNGWICSHGVLD